MDCMDALFMLIALESHIHGDICMLGGDQFSSPSMLCVIVCEALLSLVERLD